MFLDLVAHKIIFIRLVKRLAECDLLTAKIAVERVLVFTRIQSGYPLNLMTDDIIVAAVWLATGNARGLERMAKAASSHGAEGERLFWMLVSFETMLISVEVENRKKRYQ